MIEFQPFPKIGRLRRDCLITEKIDGTNAQIIMDEEGNIQAASRNRLIYVGDDNYGFAAWVDANKADLLTLGPGRHFGEWWGSGVQRGYGLAKGEKRFSLFNTSRWSNSENRPKCCGVVPVLYHGDFTTGAVDYTLRKLVEAGSVAAPGFMRPEGVVVLHLATKQMFKVTCENDDEPKGMRAEAARVASLVSPERPRISFSE